MLVGIEELHGGIQYAGAELGPVQMGGPQRDQRHSGQPDGDTDVFLYALDAARALQQKDCQREQGGTGDEDGQIEHHGLVGIDRT